jgi:hypothetical protein
MNNRIVSIVIMVIDECVDVRVKLEFHFDFLNIFYFIFCISIFYNIKKLNII